MNSHWRAISAQVIARVLKETAGADEKIIKQALRDAYPFGQRAHHPYKIWCSEIRRQRGFAKPTTKVQRQKKAAMVVAGQGSLLEEV